jgi:Zn-dependent M28 family amino/carboxypeptidase
MTPSASCGRATGSRYPTWLLECQSILQQVAVVASSSAAPIAASLTSGHVRVLCVPPKADGTTLGADNGIGVAAMLALLDAPKEAKLPPLEALFTVVSGPFLV